MKWFMAILFVTAIVLLGSLSVYSSDDVGKNSAQKPETLSAVSISDMELAVLEEINARRITQNVAPLKSNNNLQEISKYRTNDMQMRGYYSHTTPDGDTFQDMLAENSGFACENLLLTEYTDVIQIVDQWENSESHRRCMLSEKSTIVGITVQKLDPLGTELSTMLVTFIAAQN